MFPWQLRKAFITDSDIFHLSRSTRSGCDRKHYCKTLWSLEWIKKKSTLVTMAAAAILNFFNPQKLPHTAVDVPTKFHEVWWKESQKIRLGVIIIKTKVILPQAQVTLAILIRPFGDFIAPKDLFGFQIFWLWSYLVIIPETSYAHYIWYLNFYLNVGPIYIKLFLCSIG